MTKTKLYSVDLSPYAARVRMQIYAKGIPDITFEQPTDWGLPKFREKFPIGRIPVLDIDGDMIPESAVIAEYLEETYPEPSLLGTTPRESAHIARLPGWETSISSTACSHLPARQVPCPVELLPLRATMPSASSSSSRCDATSGHSTDSSARMASPASVA